MQAHKSAAFHRAFTKADLCEYYVNLEANTFDTFKVEPSDYTGKRILLVEDNELNREIGVEILQMTGAEVETAENGKIAVEKVEVSPKG